MTDNNNCINNLPVKKRQEYNPIRVELNFLRHFIFSLDNKKESDPGNVITITRERVYTDGRKVKAELIVYVDYEYGRCGSFDYRAFRAVEKILTDIYSALGELPEGQIRLGSEYSILKQMGYKQMTKEKYQRLRIFFTRMRRMHFHSEFATFDPVRGRWSEGGEALDPLYKKVVLAREKMPDDTIADAVYVWLGDFYRRSLNKKYVAILDWNFYNSIKNLSARRLYEIISIYSHKHTTVLMMYSDICARMQLQREKYQSLAKHQLQRIYNELIEKGFLKAASWQIQNGGVDWLIKFEINKNHRIQMLCEQSNSDLTHHESQVVSDTEIVSDTEQIIYPSEEDQRWYRFMKYYVQGCKKISKVEYIFPKKGSKEYFKISELFTTYKEGFVKKLIDQFFTTQDPYITKQSYSVTFFLAPTTINKLITEIAQKEASKNDKTIEDQKRISAEKEALTEAEKEENRRLLREELKKIGLLI